MRLELTIAKAQEAELKELCVKLNMSYQEVFNNSLTLLQYLVEEKQRGKTPATIDEQRKVYTSINMPMFDNISGEPKPEPKPRVELSLIKGGKDGT